MEQTSDERHFWLVEKYGRPQKALKLRSSRREPLARGLVRVEVRAIGLNFADVFSVQGLYSAAPRPPFIPGLEFSGVVIDEGEEWSDTDRTEGSNAKPEDLDRPPSFRKGDRVMGVTRFGAYSTTIDIHPSYLRKIPEDWSFDQGAAFPVQALTAGYGLVHLGGIREGSVVLIQSAAGGVGLYALQIARKRGARIIAVAGSSEKKEFLLREFALEENQVLVRNTPRRFALDLDQALDFGNQRSGNGLDLIFDSVYGRYFWPMYHRLNPGGRYALFGAADFTPATGPGGILRTVFRYLRRPWPDPMKMISDNRSLMGFNLIYLYHQGDLLGGLLDDLLSMGFQKPVIKKTFPFENLPEALAYFQSGSSTGKVIVHRNREQAQ